MKFINLYLETEYSILKSTIKIPQLIAFAKQNNIDTLAISDQNVMYGAYKFYKQCKENSIKPVIGLNLSITSDNNEIFQILLYSKSLKGYQNLMNISSLNLINEGKIRIDDIKEFCEELILVFPSDESEIFASLYQNNHEEALRILNKYSLLFSDIYLGLDMQGTIKKVHFESIINQCNKLNLKCVAINKTRYLSDSDYETYRMVRSIDLNTNNYEADPKEVFYNFISQDDATEIFKNYPELLLNTENISNLCNLQIEIGSYHFPSYFGKEEKKDPKQYLDNLCKYGLQRRLENQNVNKKQYLDRLLYELKVIEDMGFADYFLIVYDFIKYAKQNGVLVGPGRGSAPSSLVAYSLGITEVDPIKYDLLFERFLNKERISMPDIDTDFPDNKREMIIRYVGEKYGINRVAHISTFGTFGVRSSIRDVSRVMKIPDLYVDEVLKQINSNITIRENINKNNRLLKFIEENENVKEMLLIADNLSGLTRNISVHAAGIVLTEDDLRNYTPLRKGLNGLCQTQYEASDLEELGLLKMDFLGLRNLTIIDEILKDINKSLAEKINIYKIPLDDKKTFEMISKGNTDGIFQLESIGMKGVLQKNKPSSIVELAYVNALYRPGPMDMIQTFVRRKVGLEKVTYLHEDLKEILAPTYGIIVFQEQIMLIACKFAGYSLGEADILRKAVSKKNKDSMIKNRDKFVQSSIKNGYDAETSNKIYDYILNFASYGFNKSHSVAYSLLAYQMAYLKTHYFTFFMGNLISNSLGSITLIKSYVSNCLRNGIKILSPNINKSLERCSIEDNKIYFPLGGIANIGYVTISQLIRERQNGEYKSYQDFILRTSGFINRKSIESLIFACALDDFGLSKKAMIESYEKIVERTKYSYLVEELSLINFVEEEYEFQIVCAKEYEMLGLNLKYNILSKFQKEKERYKCIDLISFPLNQKENALICIRSFREIKTKKGTLMAFLQVYDETDQVDAVIFPDIYVNFKNNISDTGIYIIGGFMENRNNKKQFVLEKIHELK